ncbi:hypothetical protein [Gorillibacterium massiliense]|uniref:hypothetical protein n=1 Tax=Gorillibacterium massiliense TaxID=1280390 RepID=UPI0004BB6A7A|nr:hypothetical protein [Gorillibacterium massiliense]
MIKEFNKALRMMETIYKRELTKEERDQLLRAYLEGYDLGEHLDTGEVQVDK